MSQDPASVRRPSRRRFLLVATGAIALASGAAGGFAWVSRRFHGVTATVEQLRRRLTRAAYGGVPLAEAIARHYDYLRLDSGAAERFARDYARWWGTDRPAEPIDEVFSRFLLSTDFFVHGADESQPVRYVRLYDPNTTPCLNYFWRTAPDAQPQV
jgi:hypothetical protein